MATKLQPGGAVQAVWRSVNELCDDVAALQKLVFQLRQDAQRRQIYGGGESGHPFRIFRATDEAGLIYKVTTGYVITTGAAFIPTNIDPDGLSLSTGHALNWIYLDITSSSAEVLLSTSTLTWSVNKIPIGWVDTTVDPPVITQFVRDHIFIPCA